MKDLKLLSLGILSTVFLFACSGNTMQNSGKDSTSTIPSSAAASGDDMYYELTSTSSGKNMAINTTIKMYVSSKGDMRTEMNMVNSASADKNTAPMIAIGHADKPDESISIDDKKKTYTINHINPADLNTGEKMQSTATKIGEEKISGFNCVHAKIISKKTMGSFYSETDTVDLWKSNEVPMQSNVKELFDQFESRTGNSMYSPEVTEQLRQLGCNGFMVKVQMASKDVSMVMQLTKMERRDFPAGMFQIPAGYTEDKD